MTPIGVQNFGIGESKSLAERFAVLRQGKSAPTHLEIETMRRKQRTHRNIMEVDRVFVQSTA